MKFFDQIRARWHAFVERLRFKYMPRIAHWVAHLSTQQARSRLSKFGPIAVLVDNTVLSHEVTHETGWVSTGMQKWGPHDVPTGYAARIPVHDPDDDSRGYQDVQYLPGIAYLARRGHITLKSSAELADERFCRLSTTSRR